MFDVPFQEEPKEYWETLQLNINTDQIQKTVREPQASIFSARLGGGSAMFNARKKIVKEKGATPNELEEEVCTPTIRLGFKFLLERFGKLFSFIARIR